MVTRDDVERQRAERFDVLLQVHTLTGGDRNKQVTGFHDLIEGYDRETLAKHVSYLADKDLLDWHAQGILSITSDGIEEIEAAVLAPDVPTEHFPSIVIAETYVHVQGDISGQVQVGTTGSTQTSGIPTEALLGVLAEVRALVNDLVLDADDAGELEADLRTVEAQVASPRPRRGIVRASLLSAQRVLEGVLTRGAIEGAERVPGAVEKLPDLIERIGHVAGQIA